MNKNFEIDFYSPSAVKSRLDVCCTNFPADSFSMAMELSTDADLCTFLANPALYIYRNIKIAAT